MSINQQQAAADFITNNPEAAVIVRGVLDQVNPAQLQTISWAQIRIGQMYVLSPTVTVLGRDLKDAIPQLIGSKSAQPNETRRDAMLCAMLYVGLLMIRGVR
jgi:hypothetical protein